MVKNPRMGTKGKIIIFANDIMNGLKSLENLRNDINQG